MTRTYGPPTHAHPNPPDPISADDALVEAVAWLHFGRNPEKALPWLTYAGQWATSKEQFDEIAKYGAQVQQLAPQAWREYQHGRLKIPMDYHPRSIAFSASRRSLRETAHVVADFDTLDGLIAHAAQLGATHVLVAGAHTKLYFPRGGQYPYEAASVWRKGRYWHSEGPGARVGVTSLPREAEPITSGFKPGRAAEARGSRVREGYRRSFFGFDVGGTVPGWTTGETWNGFSVPCFTARQLPAVMALLQAGGGLEVTRHGDDVHVMVEGDPESVGIVQAEWCAQLGEHVWCFEGYTWYEYPEGRAVAREANRPARRQRERIARKIRVSYDFENSPTFDAWSFGDLWNGFLVPEFEYRVAKQVAANSVLVTIFDPDTDSFYTFAPYPRDPEPEEFSQLDDNELWLKWEPREIQTTDGPKKTWSIGGMAFTWEEDTSN